ncbi:MULTISPECIES: lipopolysaccharide transport periplasmic protein LptA [unclassified Colwellia]|uniref:lipopolysaccharide transport periplasmic protein LptA n=1 Tax=unclassified Colwellia TaxID=196834 RepID=UPI0015F738AA|nr:MULTISPECIES: lipopolysaccharide transport periplasmic protein LptA [unclassified Colwellia]MBA6232719.1 lipopolysaccharide transport periplasmic protein LptA [Colwellia sp. MB02u-7]MBA6236193.1 lipopolysaccharide transport periplasmic protein LptA [Colwellia sp. MB02u-11]MBA6256555.1 lipopolysaccharide transport periplasmic protein LptA [Colwellia sp. MB3u-28]MBA6261270.1 lipopolysaccharide transport periplasmic protein LptA [Colwellia sp. MB3u-41]MBA6298407.1 lipopolysaccharide transport 
MKLLKNSLLCLILSGALLSSAFAEKFDISQKIEIDASRQAADLKNKIFSYIDNVVITQGSLIIRADLVQVLTQSGSEEKTYIAKGKPATFEQTLTDGTLLNLQADEIRYEPGNNLVIISGNALLQQEDSEVSGSKITYNIDTQYVNAESKTNERTKTIFQPKEKVQAKKNDTNTLEKGNL